MSCRSDIARLFAKLSALSSRQGTAGTGPGNWMHSIQQMIMKETIKWLLLIGWFRSTTQSRYTGCNSSDNWSTVPRRLSEGQRMHPPNGLGVTSVTDDVKNEMMSFLEEKRLDNAESDGPNVGFELIRISQETRQPTESALPSSAGRSATLQILANNGAGLQEKNKVMEWRNPINVSNKWKKNVVFAYLSVRLPNFVRLAASACLKYVSSLKLNSYVSTT